MATMLSSQADAQDLKSLIKGVAQNVIGDKATTASSIIGTWTYVKPDCRFESESFLAKAGGEVAASRVEDQMQGVFEKLGMDKLQYVFNEDGTYTSTVKRTTTKGTYEFNEEDKTITFKTRLGIKSVAYVSVIGKNMSLVFNSDKLMTVIKTMTSLTSGVNAATSTLNTVAEQYDGMMLGFELTK